LYKPLKLNERPINIIAVPYCMWGNRKPGEMQVWVRY
jgi:uncharacterized protein